MIWYDTIRYDMIRYDTLWYAMIWYDMIWYDMYYTYCTHKSYILVVPRDWRPRTHQWHRPQSSFCWQKASVSDGDSNAALPEAKEACDLVLKQMPENTKALGFEVIDSTMSWFNTKDSIWFYECLDRTWIDLLVLVNTILNKHKSSISDILHSMNKHHRDSKANSLNESGPVTKLWGAAWCGLRTAWHRRCTVERKLKCSNVNMWRPDFGQSLWSFHRKIFRLFFCNLLQHCARISYHRKTSKGHFFVWKYLVSDLSQWRCLLWGMQRLTPTPRHRSQHTGQRMDDYTRIYYIRITIHNFMKDHGLLVCLGDHQSLYIIYCKIWQDLELCNGCRWSSKTTELFDLFWFLISFNIEFNFLHVSNALPTKYENLPCHSTESRESPGRKLVASGRKQHWSERSSSSVDKLTVEICRYTSRLPKNVIRSTSSFPMSLSNSLRQSPHWIRSERMFRSSKEKMLMKSSLLLSF